jgi:8-oxo-dGTP diphosphatase
LIMNKDKFPFLVAVYLILIKDKKVLLIRRFKTGWRDGDYTLPAGHVDGREDIAWAAAREMMEEVGIEVKETDLKVVHVAHHASDGEYQEYIDFYLEAKNWIGEAVNMEPDKCDDLGWFSLDSLPKNTLPNVRKALEYYQKKELFSEFKYGFNKLAGS